MSLKNDVNREPTFALFIAMCIAALLSDTTRNVLREYAAMTVALFIVVGVKELKRHISEG